MSSSPSTIPSVLSRYPNTFHLPTVSTVLPQQTQASMSLNDLVQLVASTKKDHLTESKVAQYNGNPLEWHEWLGQFKSVIESAALTDDVKLTYLKMLVARKAKTAIAEFPYSGTIDRDALKTLECKLGQPQAVVSAFFDKLNSFPPVKINNSDHIINFLGTNWNLIAVSRSLNYAHDFSTASLLNQAVPSFFLRWRRCGRRILSDWTGLNIHWLTSTSG